MAEHPNLTAALAAAQGEFPAIEKKSMNPHFGKKYADLADGMTAVRPALSKNGIAYTQTFHVADGILILRTTLRYGSEELSSELPISQPARPQEFVALTTYYRRVGLFSICGITPAEEDDDGNTANDVANTQAPPRQTARQAMAAKPPLREIINGNAVSNGRAKSPLEEVEEAIAPADPWAIDGKPIEAAMEAILLGIRSRPGAEVKMALEVYRARLELTDHEQDQIEKALGERMQMAAARKAAQTHATN